MLAQSKFVCSDKKDGYYADTGLGCQIFHYCVQGAKHSWMCPERKLFLLIIITDSFVHLLTQRLADCFGFPDSRLPTLFFSLCFFVHAPISLSFFAVAHMIASNFTLSNHIHTSAFRFICTLNGQSRVCQSDSDEAHVLPDTTLQNMN